MKCVSLKNQSYLPIFIIFKYHINIKFQKQFKTQQPLTYQFYYSKPHLFTSLLITTKMEGDDFLNQEQYIIDFPDEITNLIETDPTFDFDLIFDKNGRAGKLVTNKTLSTQYLFRVFLLPCNTESYTSVDNNYFYKNADVSELILVFDPQNSPIVLQDYEALEQKLILRAEKGIIPQEITFPHGLTPPTRWAALELQPNILPVPKYQFQPSKYTVRMQYDENASEKTQAKQALEQKRQTLQQEHKQLEDKLATLLNTIQSIKNNNAQVDQQKITEEEQLRLKMKDIERQLESLNDNNGEKLSQSVSKSKRTRQSKVQLESSDSSSE